MTATVRNVNACFSSIFHLCFISDNLVFYHLCPLRSVIIQGNSFVITFLMQFVKRK